MTVNTNDCTGKLQRGWYCHTKLFSYSVTVKIFDGFSVFWAGFALEVVFSVICYGYVLFRTDPNADTKQARSKQKPVYWVGTQP